MKVRKLYETEAELLRNENLSFDEEEGDFDDNWSISAGDLFGCMTFPDEEFSPPFQQAA